jgi:hypothetical protein
MPLRREVLREYATSQRVELTATQRDTPRRIAPSITVVPSIGAEGAYDLTPGSSIGAVRRCICRTYASSESSDSAGPDAG